MAFEMVNKSITSANIKVIGVGGGGGNAVDHMVAADIGGVEFICANTDAQALGNVKTTTTLQLGTELTKGLGAGANPCVGRSAAEADKEQIKELLKGADMVFIAAGMGGGTGTGAAPVVAQIAKELEILTVAVVTKPFEFEGKRRMEAANEGIEQLRTCVDSLIVIPNERLLQVLGDLDLMDAFGKANDVLLGAVKGIAEIITVPGIINVDFADVRTVMKERGMAMMGAGAARGEQRAQKAAEQAIRSPLLESIDLDGAQGVLVNVTAKSLGMKEFSEVNQVVREFAAENADVIVGTSRDDSLDEDELRVTVVAAGMRTPEKATDKTSEKKQESRPFRSQTSARPATARQTAAQSNVRPHPAASSMADQASMLDIPTFLRKQAD